MQTAMYILYNQIKWLVSAWSSNELCCIMFKIFHIWCFQYKWNSSIQACQLLKYIQFNAQFIIWFAILV